MEKHKDEYIPSVSLIIAAYNEEKVIENKIKNSMQLNYLSDKIEILIGSDGSDDRTDEICKRYEHIIKFIRIAPRQGKANVLNTLVPHARGDIILFSDANSILEKDTLTKIVTHFNNNTVGGVCGRLILESNKDSLESYEGIYWNYETKIKQMESEVFSTIGSNGGIYAIRRELYKIIPKDTIIDDFWISVNILEQGKRICFEKNAVAREKVSENIKDEFWRKVRIGSGNLQTFVRKPLLLGVRRWFVLFAYFSHKVIRWLVPFILILIYLTNLFLSFNQEFVIFLYISHLIILIGLLGIILNINIKMFNLISYFLLFNGALLLGYVMYFLGKQKVTWKRAER